MLTQNRVSMANPFLARGCKEHGCEFKESTGFPVDDRFPVFSQMASYDAKFVSNYTYINVVDQIKRIQGVGDVTVFGGC